jgi:hypothetical protein
MYYTYTVYDAYFAHSTSTSHIMHDMYFHTKLTWCMYGVLELMLSTDVMFVCPQSIYMYVRQSRSLT